MPHTLTNSNALIISEQFYGIQGDDTSIGTQAIFLRLARCNLDCVGFSKKQT